MTQWTCRFNKARSGILLLALASSFCLACATIESPTGGPEDVTPPEIVHLNPDSGSVGLQGVDKLVIRFSEKVEPKSANRILKFFPDLEVKKTKWRSRQTMEVIFTDTLPADTVIVVELTPGFTDVHRVKIKEAHIFPIATADSLPRAIITGLLIHKEEPVVNGVIELYAVPPDTVEWSRQPILRRAPTDSNGMFILPWLESGSGPFLLHAFVDRNGDYRSAENEPQRLLPGEFSIPDSTFSLDTGLFIIYSPTDPGLLATTAMDSLILDRSIFGWSMKISDEDTGFVPVHARKAPHNQTAVIVGDSTIWENVGPGLVRTILFADLNGDSLLSAMAMDTLITKKEIPDTSSADSTASAGRAVAGAWTTRLSVGEGRERT